MKPRPRSKIYLGIALGMILILGLAAIGIFKLQESRTNRSLSKVAKPVIKMDLLAPQDHGWISDHEIFFLREKNQGDFMCIKTDIRDGKETVLEALSPYLRDKEDRSISFEMQASPSGKRIGMLFGSKSDREIYIHNLETSETLSIENKPVLFFMESWLPDESGWILWNPKLLKNEDNEIKLAPIILGSNTNGIIPNELVLPSFTEPELFLDSENMLAILNTDIESPTFDITMAILKLPDELEPKENHVHMFTSDFPMTIYFQLSHDGNGKNWIIGHRSWRTIWKITRKNTFPYVDIDTVRYQLKLFERGPNRTITLDPDVEFQYPKQIQLNPSGTHFSFIYQGQIWVAATADLRP